MSNELTITNQEPIDLTGSINAGGDLELSHGTNNLANHSHTLEIEHDDYNSSGGLVTVKILDFRDGDEWEMSASHGAAPTNWTRGSDHAYHDVGLVTGLVEVDVVATSDASPSETKTRKIWIKTTPTNPLPDKP